MSSKRNRPGKLERMASKRQATLTANQQYLDDLKSKPNDLAAKTAKAFGPAKFDKALRQSGTGRDRLKLGSYGVGFQGPRGFNSPKGNVSKQEQQPGLMAPKPTGPTFGANASKRHAGDVRFGAEAFGYDYATPSPSDTVMRKVGRKGRWKKV